MGCSSVPQFDTRTLKVISRKADQKLDQARVREDEKSDQDRKIGARKRGSLGRKAGHRRQSSGRRLARFPINMRSGSSRLAYT